MSLSSASAYSNWEPPSPDELQGRLAAFEIVRLIGKGGMGAVYEGVQRNLDRRVAIKLMPEVLYRSEEGAGHNFEERFQREARAMARLDHPSIVAVYDFGKTSDEAYFLAMEYIDGLDIHQYRHQCGGKIDGSHALVIGAHVLEALAYAHGQGIVHRDIKPANILINSAGRIKVADFGLAKRLETDGEASLTMLTMPNMAMGTPDYAAPEVTQMGATPDHRVDIYAVGVMLYEILTGEVPRGRWIPPSERVPSLDPRIDAMVEKALESNPDDRFADAAGFRAALDHIMTVPSPKTDGTGPVKLNLGTPAAKKAPSNEKAEPPLARKVEKPVAQVGDAAVGEEASRKLPLAWILSGAVALLAVALFVVVRGQSGDSAEATDAETSTDAVTSSSPPEVKPPGVYAELGDKLNAEIERREKQKSSRPSPPEKKADEPKMAASASSSAPKASKTDEQQAPKTITVPEPSEYSPVAIDQPGPPVVGRWRPLADPAGLSRDGQKLENGDAFLLPCKAAQVRLKDPIETVLIRWRGFRGNSMSVEYKSDRGEPGRRSNHVGPGGGTQAHLGPPSGPGAARSFDTHWYLLIRGKQKHQWEVHDGRDPAVSVNFGEQSSATEIKQLSITTWNPHEIPYFKPALIRQCDTLIPTEEQLAELLGARTTAALLALPWVGFPADEAYDAFLDGVDDACGKLAAADFRGARVRAEELLVVQPLLEQNPHRDVLESVRDTAAALIAMAESNMSGMALPDLRDNGSYQLDPVTGHAFVNVPLLLTPEEAAAYVEKTGGHLATLPPSQPSQTSLVKDWLIPTVPLGIAMKREGRIFQAWHLGGSPVSRSSWAWCTGETLPLSGEGALWRDRHPSYDPHLALVWVLSPRGGQSKRVATLGWETVSAATRAFPLIEFPAPATRYPEAKWNHPSARDAAPASTGDPVLDFERRFSHQWHQQVTEPWTVIDQTLREKYAGALDGRSRAVAQSGDLDAVVPWHFEIRTVREGGTPPPLDDSSPEDLRRLRQVWDAEAAKVAAQREALIAQAVVNADAELAAIEKQLVQAQQIDQAATVQARRKELAARENLPE
ncbi:MAG: serine/threonine protein kinase [Verrucomicrobiae bacterium]|nr:serine/threonine protein kinase [Verrucomicrobiae bacterium]